ncbi:MAG: hypothetical protein QOF42_2457 [Gammaproteobacteria bacterium]|jgi:hypothetical protein|nr:hypothetical protein [Gammaproteobacteria bacterium]
MKTKILRSAALVLSGSILALTAGTAQADITIQRSTSVEGVGAMAFANMSGTSTTMISGDKSRTDSDMKMQSAIIGFLARNSVGPSAEIVLLDQDKLYHLNINKKEYTETSFEQLRAQMQKMSDQMNSTDNKRQQPSAIDQSKCEWLPAKVDVNKSGEKGQFAGYDAQRVTVTATQPCKDKETGAICEIALVLDQWMSADFAESGEARKFYSAYASKMGMDPSASQDASQRAKALFAQYKGVWTEVASKMQTVKGYPVKSSFTLGMGGTQCKDANSQQPQQAQSSPAGDNPTTPSGIAGAVAGKLGGLFKKKDTSDVPAAQPAPAVAAVAMPPGDVALMTVSSQLVSVSTGGVSADAFSVPAGFKKLEMKTQ